MTHRRVRWAAAAALLGIACLSTPADAHATLVRTSPANGTELDRAPEVVSATFDGPVRLLPDGLRIYDSNGTSLASGEGEYADGGRTAVLNAPSLRDGAYVFTWRVISADGHPVPGGITFHVGPARDVDAALLSDVLQRQRGSRLVSSLALGADVVGYAGGALLVGCLVGMTALGLPRRRGLVIGPSAVLALSALAGVVLDVPHALGTSLSAVLGEPSLLADGVRTREGTLGLAQAALAFVVLLLATRSQVWARPRWALWGPAIGAVGIDALFGHSVAGSAVAVWVLVDATHLLAALGWVGALGLLTRTLRRGADNPDSVRAFSRWAAWAVGVLIATGAAQAIREVGGWTPLVSTSYGHVLLLKLMLVELMLVAAVASRAEVRRHRTGGKLLIRSVTVEAALGLVVLVVTSVLVGTAPAGRAYDHPATVTAVDFDRAMALRVTADPARHGRVRLRLVVHRHEGDHDHENPTPLPVRALTARMSLPARDIGPILIALTRVEPGVYVAEEVDVPVAGEWQIEGSVLLSENDQVTLLVRLTFR